MSDFSSISILHDAASRSVELSTERCTILCIRPSRGVVVIKVQGKGCGALYEALFNQLEPDLVSDAPVEMFIDTRQASGSTINIVEWVNFLSADHGLFSCVHILAASSVISLSANIIKHLSRTGELLRIYSDPPSYNRQLQQAVRARQAA